MKKSLILAISLVLLISLVQAKIEISTTQESFEAGENITLRVSLLDSNNNPINDQVNLLIEDGEKVFKLEKTIPSNEFVDIDMGEGIMHGYWSATVNYNEEQAKTIFLIEMQELAKFELNNNILKITNIGNTRYSKTIQIIIGDTIGVRNPKIDVGKSIEYRLVAPEGDYNIKVTDGMTTLERKQVQLTGTGHIIGALDQQTSTRSGITGGIAPDEDDEMALLSYMKQSSLIYVFILVVFGVAILLALQRKLLKK